MINSKQLLHDFVSKITLPFDTEECLSIGYRVLEKVIHLTRTEIMLDKQVVVPSEKLERITQLIDRINRHEPIQYILNEADFYGRRFFVDSSVLIPRPETEELVHLIIEYCRTEKIIAPSILDIGTGSGCIPITLSKEIENSKVHALDKSADALTVAKRNARILHADVNFFESDIFFDKVSLNELDIVVSNPPYIAKAEQKSMAPNVTDFEPHMALFVDDKDPLVFYTVIAEFGISTLKPGGLVAVEINERFGTETRSVFDRAGYMNTKLIKDLSGKDRFVFAWKDFAPTNSSK
jgi:release factor glutamine methyltransferase